MFSSFLALFFLISILMKPLFSRRFRLVFSLWAFLFFSHNLVFAQDFSLYDNIQQLESRIRQAGNATLVINFWATWCKPCVEELPCFDELREHYAGRDMQVLLVSLDFKSQLEKNSSPSYAPRKSNQKWYCWPTRMSIRGFRVLLKNGMAPFLLQWYSRATSGSFLWGNSVLWKNWMHLYSHFWLKPTPPY